MTGIMPQAYQLRDGEDALSVNWLERVPGSLNERLVKTAELIRDTQDSKKLGPKSRLAVSNVDVFHDVCRRRQRKVRIVHAPVEGNEPHSEVRQFPQDDLELLDALALEAVLSHHRVGDLLP